MPARRRTRRSSGRRCRRAGVGSRRRRGSSARASSPASIAPTRAVGVAHGVVDLDRLAALGARRPRSASGGRRPARGRGPAARCGSAAPARPAGASSGSRSRSLQPRPAARRRPGASEVGAADEVVEASHAERRHQLAHAARPRTAGSGRRAPGVPAKRRRSSGSCVAIPTGHVFRWQTRIITQPSATSGAVENANSSAPSSAPISDVAARCAGRRRPAAGRGRGGRS